MQDRVAMWDGTNTEYGIVLILKIGATIWDSATMWDGATIWDSVTVWVCAPMWGRAIMWDSATICMCLCYNEGLCCYGE